MTGFILKEKVEFELSVTLALSNALRLESLKGVTLQTVGYRVFHTQRVSL